jgi:hypothetical protein
VTKQFRIEEAARAKEAATAALYRDDGAKVYGDEEHTERQRQIMREHTTARRPRWTSG